MKKTIEKFTELLENFLNFHSYYVLPSGDSPISLKFYNESRTKSKVRIKFTNLISRAKIEILKKSDGLHVLIDTQYANLILGKKISAKKYFTYLGLYFFHELVHVQDQNIGEMRLVTHLRGEEDVWGQMLLLMYDFEADRKAIAGTKKFLAHILAEVDEVELLKIQSESLCDFPSGTSHNKHSKKRKDIRLVANRLFYLAKRENFFERQLETPENYFMVRWGRAFDPNHEFEFCLSLCGSSNELLGIANINQRQLDILNSASSEGDSASNKLKELDKVLLEILDNLHLGK
jgi:hypothetical protein